MGFLGVFVFCLGGFCCFCFLGVLGIFGCFWFLVLRTSGDFLSLGPYFFMVPFGDYLDYFCLGFWKANPRKRGEECAEGGFSQWIAIG